MRRSIVFKVADSREVPRGARQREWWITLSLAWVGPSYPLHFESADAFFCIARRDRLGGKHVTFKAAGGEAHRNKQNEKSSPLLQKRGCAALLMLQHGTRPSKDPRPTVQYRLGRLWDPTEPYSSVLHSFGLEYGISRGTSLPRA